MRIGARVSVHRSQLVHSPDREGNVTREKVDLAKLRISFEGWVAILKGRLLPNGKIQVAVGNNRLVALNELQYDGLIDIQLYDDCTDKEFGKIYLDDNNAVDSNCTQWAMHAVVHAVSILGPAYANPSSELDADLSRLMGVRNDVVPDLRKMDMAISQHTLAPEVEKIREIDYAIYFWARVEAVGGVPLGDQTYYILNRLIPGLHPNAPKGVAIKDPISTIKAWSHNFDPNFGKKPRRAKPNIKFHQELSLDEKGDKVRMALENFISDIENTEEPVLRDDVQQDLRSLCEKFIQICDGVTTEVSNG
jgi:hypothetical protein